MSQRCTSKAPDVLSEVLASLRSNFDQDLQAPSRASEMLLCLLALQQDARHW